MIPGNQDNQDKEDNHDHQDNQENHDNQIRLAHQRVDFRVIFLEVQSNCAYLVLGCSLPADYHSGHDLRFHKNFALGIRSQDSRKSTTGKEYKILSKLVSSLFISIFSGPNIPKHIFVNILCCSFK